MNIIAIDASTKSSGIAVYKHNQLIKHTCITASSSDLFNRIKVMVDQIKNIIIQDPDIEYIVLEQVRQEGFVNIKTYKALMYLQGCIGMMLHQNFKHIQLDFMYPSEWRKVCQIKQGRGVQRTKQKENDILWVKQNFNLDVNDDIADAIGLGYAYINKD